MRKASLAFQWKRFRGFLGELRKSKRSVLGLAILIFYVGFGIAAPLLTPYDPLNSEFLAGEQAHPLWWRSLPGGSALSENQLLLDHPGFTTPSSFDSQGWNASSNPAQSFAISYNATESIHFRTISAQYPGSEEVVYSRAASDPIPPSPGGNITISKSFVWPYTGPPKRFAGFLQLALDDLRGVGSIDVQAFIAREGTPLKIWETSLTQSSLGNPLIPTFALDSYGAEIKGIFGPTVDPANFIFLDKGTYTFGIQIVIPDQNQSANVSVKLFLNGLNLRLYGTSWGLLGTDQYGRDIFTQLAWGTRISLIVGLVASALAVAVGLVVGLIAGYLGKVVDEILMRSTDLLLVLPGLPLLIVLAALLGASIWNVIGVLGLLGWPGFARIIRSQVLSLKERAFIEASKAAGSGVSHIITKHVIPNVMGLTYVSLATAVPTAIVSESALAFLGLWDPTVISWGRMLFDVETNGAIKSWWWVLPPGLSIALLSMSFVLLGYALDEILNPRLRMRR